MIQLDSENNRLLRSTIQFMWLSIIVSLSIICGRPTSYQSTFLQPSMGPFYVKQLIPCILPGPIQLTSIEIANNFCKLIEKITCIIPCTCHSTGTRFWSSIIFTCQLKLNNSSLNLYFTQFYYLFIFFIGFDNRLAHCDNDRT